MQKVYAKAKLFSYALLKGLQAPTELPNIKKLFKEGDISQLKKIATFFNWETVLKESDYEKMLDALISENRIESVYLNIPQWIEKMLILEDVRFLFLIDDLDRCLPENALKMLESIKLFLNVAGCSFVLALDDDVIERGVEHNYKEYKLDGNDATLPITGNEYLEKIIQLPFRIPPKDSDDIEKLLKKHNDIFENNNELKEFFIQAIPLLPRKVIRAVILIVQNFDNNIDKILLVKITFLELFAPKLYRFIKNNDYIWVFNRLLTFLNDKDINHLTETAKMQEWAKNNIKAQKEKERTYHLINIIKEINRARVDFNLDIIFNNINIKTQENKLHSYIKLKDTRSKQEKSIPTTDKEIKYSQPIDEKQFFDYLFSNDPLSWELAFSKETGLENSYIKINNNFIEKAKQFDINPKWLEIVVKHLSKEDFKKLIKETKPIERLLDEK